VIDFFTSIGSLIMAPLYYVTSFLLTSFHTAFTALFGESDAGQGWAWAMSIVGLTIVVRILLIPLFVKQIKSSRNMQLLQPRVRELQKKYAHDRERLAQETMALYRETGTNPFASCLPILMQAPIFLSLFRLIDQATKGSPRGVMTEAQAAQLSEATLFGAKISGRFIDAPNINTQILAIVLVLAMTGTTFTTQRQLMSKNMPPEAMKGQYAQTQKMLLYVLPVAFAVGGVAFPIGVLLYWTTSNLWTMGQQFYVIRNNPAPGTPAARAKAERDARKGKKQAAPAESPEVTEAPKPVQRNQPKRRSRSSRRQPTKGSTRPAQPAPEKQSGGAKTNPQGGSGAKQPKGKTKSGGKQTPKKRPSKDGEPDSTAGSHDADGREDRSA
jgi:YidC/Oxa1 family membrane protein insertase